MKKAFFKNTKKPPRIRKNLKIGHRHVSTLHDWLQYLDRGIPVDAIYLDFRKAFDTVPHKRLLGKLWVYGVRGQVLKEVEDFLSDRYQYVSVTDKTSQKIPVTSGVVS